MLSHFLILSVFLLGLSEADSAPDPLIQDRLEALVEDFRGDVGIYVRHLETGEEVALNADTVFPTASMIKVPILLKTFQRIEEGELAYDQMLAYHDSLYYPGHDILNRYKEGGEIRVGEVIMLMMTMSDNTASLWLQELVGTGTAINDWLAEHGMVHTRVNSRTEGRNEAFDRYGWGQTTPREMAELLVMIRDGEAVSPGASEQMYRILSRNYWDEEALSQIPPTVQAVSKNGAVSRSRSEVVLVNAPSGDYVFCVITKNQEDTSRDYDSEGFELIRAVSRILWQHFEPEDGWEPTPRAGPRS